MAGDPPAGAGGPHVTTHRLRFNDTDALGHVNNAVFAVMLEQGRSELAADGGLPVGSAAASLVIVRLELDFVHEMMWPGDVRIETAVARIGNRSFTLDQVLHHRGTVCARARTVLVVMDRVTRRAAALTDEQRDALRPWLAVPG